MLLYWVLWSIIEINVFWTVNQVTMDTLNSNHTRVKKKLGNKKKDIYKKQLSTCDIISFWKVIEIWR